jgi:NADP-dependent 3-hydroxy acid dehydrogenase YdfG
MQNKVVFISGATGGIGQATAKLLAKNHCIVVITGRSEQSVSKTVTEFASEGLAIKGHVLDVKNTDDFKRVIDQTISDFGRIDVLINNAGIMPLSYLEELKVHEWMQTVDVNVKGVLNGIAAVIPWMKKQGEGQIINIASIAGTIITPGTSVYSASKAAVIAITEGLRQEFKGIIRATAICPGVVKTGLASTITNQTIKQTVEKMQDSGLSADDIASAIWNSITLPKNVSINELVIRASHF